MESAQGFLTAQIKLSPGLKSSASSTRTQMKIFCEVENERFTFDVDSKNALVGSILER
jgi:hypothetical protein